MKKIISRTVLSVLIFTLVTGCGGSERETQEYKSGAQILEDVSVVHAVGKVSPEEDWIIISSAQDGILTRLLVAEGDTVVSGQIIMQLDHGEADIEVDIAQARLTSLQQESKSIVADIQKAKVAADDLKKKYETSQSLFQQGAETKEQMDTDYANWLQQEATVRSWEQKLSAQQASQREQLAQVSLVDRQMKEFQISAPDAGIIVDLTARMGMKVLGTEELGKILKPTDKIIEAEVDELFANDVRAGQEVWISPLGRTDTIAQGKVSYVSPVLSNKSILYETANEAQDRRVRRIKVTLTSEAPLAINAKVDCEIKIR